MFKPSLGGFELARQKRTMMDSDAYLAVLHFVRSNFSVVSKMDSRNLHLNRLYWA